MNNEVWKPIQGYEKYYLISNEGHVYSQRYRKNLKPNLVGNGYEAVGLYKDGTCEKRYVHRLVAEHFIENPDNLPMVNHKDENIRNNHVDNLEWCTKAYNNNYGTKNFRQMKKLGKPCAMMKGGEVIKTFYSAKQAARYLGKTSNGSGSISECLNGKQKTAYGYEWQFIGGDVE